MPNKINIDYSKQILIVYIVLTLVTLAVYWQVNRYDFVTIDDDFYVTNNSNVQSGITPESIHWAFTNHGLLYPLVWISFMADYELYGFHAGGYHVTNIFLHLMSTLLLFWLLNRMTHSVWRSAFVAGLFALHPLHVESVAWIAERKDVLSGFFWMLTLCCYVYYTEKPVIKRYLLVLFSFILALLSKSMVITLPIVMLLLDYWPLGRLQSDKHQLSRTKIAGIIPLWQVKEKIPFIILSAFIAILTFSMFKYSPPYLERFSIWSRLANAPLSFVTYIRKTFWPYDLSILYPFPEQLPVWQVLGAVLAIFVISVAVVVAVKRSQYFLVGWLWYAVTILPVIGIIQVGNEAMADRYSYLPSIGIYIMLAWGIPVLFPREEVRTKILFPAGIAFLFIMAVLAWNQCGYWKNSITLFNHTLQVTKDNSVAHRNLGNAFLAEEKNREAISHYNEAIRLNPKFADNYLVRGMAYDKMGQPLLAIIDFSEAIRHDNHYAGAYHVRGTGYNKSGQYQLAIDDFDKAIGLKQNYFEAYNSRGITYYKLGQYHLAIDDFNKAISLKPGTAEVLNNRSFAYFKQGNNRLGLLDAQKACESGTCIALEWAKRNGINY